MRGSSGGGGGGGGGQGVRIPLKNHKNIGSLSNTGPDPLKIYQASIQCWAIIGTPAKRHLNGRFELYLDPLINYKKKLDPL